MNKCSMASVILNIISWVLCRIFPFWPILSHGLVLMGTKSYQYSVIFIIFWCMLNLDGVARDCSFTYCHLGCFFVQNFLRIMFSLKGHIFEQWWAIFCVICHSWFFFLLLLKFHTSCPLNSGETVQKKNILLIVAHPDDESM